MEKERDEAKEEAQVARLATQRQRQRVTYLGFRMRWQLRRKAGWQRNRPGVRVRLPVWKLSRRLLCWRSGWPRIKYALSTPKPTKTRRPWRRITRRPWRSFLLTATDVVFSNTTFVETNQRFLIICPTPPSRCLLSSS